MYASNEHLGFSLRATLVGWLGGVPKVTPEQARTASREGWWGEVVPVTTVARSTAAGPVATRRPPAKLPVARAAPTGRATAKSSAAPAPRRTAPAG
jgi:hypothetical protein